MDFAFVAPGVAKLNHPADANPNETPDRWEALAAGCPLGFRYQVFVLHFSSAE
jgi:hypothetical protein